MTDLEYRLRLQEIDNQLVDLSRRMKADLARWDAEEAEEQRLAQILDEGDPTPEQAIAYLETVLADLQTDRQQANRTIRTPKKEKV